MEMKRFDMMRSTVQKLNGIIEVLIMTITYWLFWQKGYDTERFLSYGNVEKYLLWGIYFLLITLIFYFEEGFKFGDLKFLDVLISQWVSMIIVNVITYFQLCLIANHILNLIPMLFLSIVDFVISFICIYIFQKIYHRYYVPRNMVMVYGSERALDLKVKMATRSDKYRISKLISANCELEYIKKEILNYDAVVVSDIPARVRNDILKYCYEKGIRTYITPKISDIILGGADKVHLFDTPLLLVKSRGLNYEQRIVKRGLDIILCGIALLFCWPLMVVIAILIKIEDGGPVFYKQRRVTMGNREFNILKFRSMIVDAEKDGKSIPATDNDPRITKVGKVIRTIRLDELPQILNILKGDMSIVGPRPERIEHIEKYTNEIPEFVYRSRVKGGLTGYAQIFGKYNTSAYDKLKLDLMYIENYTLLLDIKLIFMTVCILFKKESTEGFDKKIMKNDVVVQIKDIENNEIKER